MALPDDVNPDSVKAWVHDLPFANKAVLSRETFELINSLPRQALTSGDRMEVLKTANHPVGIVLDHLRGQIIADHPKAPLFLSLGEEFCRLMSRSYTDIVDDLNANRAGFFNERAVLAAVERAGEYHERRLLLRALVHHAPPKGEWKALKKLYLGSKERHRAPFYRAIALHLCGTNRLAPGTILKVQALLEELPVERLVEMKRPVPVRDHSGFYLPDGDGPPLYGPVPAGAQLLSLTRLLNAVDNMPAPGLDARVIQDLRDHWSTDKRAKERRVTPSKVLRTRAVFGFHDILRCLHETPVVAAVEEDTFELSDSSFATAPRSPVAYTVEVMDISDRGCRLRAKHSGARSGEVVAVQWGSGAWRIGIVAWFISEGDDWEFGLQWLIEFPKPVLLRFDSPEPHPALRGRHIESGNEVMVHAAVHGSYRANCWIQQEDGWQRSRLTVIERRGLVEVARTEAVVELRHEAEAPKPKPAPASPFQDVWDALSPFSGSAAVSTRTGDAVSRTPSEEDQ